MFHKAASRYTSLRALLRGPISVLTRGLSSPRGVMHGKTVVISGASSGELRCCVVLCCVVLHTLYCVRCLYVLCYSSQKCCCRFYCLQSTAASLHTVPSNSTTSSPLHPHLLTHTRYWRRGRKTLCLPRCSWAPDGWTNSLLCRRTVSATAREPLQCFPAM